MLENCTILQNQGSLTELSQCQLNLCYLSDKVENIENLSSQLTQRDYLKALPIIQEEENCSMHDMYHCRSHNHSIKEIKRRKQIENRRQGRNQQHSSKVNIIKCVTEQE